MDFTPRLDDAPLRNVVYAFLLAACYLYLFRLKRWKPLQVAEPRQQNVTAELAWRANDFALYEIDGPTGRISSLIFLADGKHLVCTCEAEKTITIQLWNKEDLGMRKPLTRLLDVAVNVIASSLDGKWVVTGDRDGRLLVWDTSLQKLCHAERHGRMITALDVSFAHVASGSDDGTVFLWTMGERGLCVVPCRPICHSSIPVSSIKFTPDGTHIASACAQWGCDVKIWYTRTGDLISSIRIGGSPTHSLAWSSNGRLLFTGSPNGSITCFDTIMRKRSVKVIEPRPGDDSITSLRISNTDQLVIACSSPGRTLDIWDIRNPPSSNPLHSFSRCVAVSLSPDDHYLATCGIDNKISIRRLSAVVEPTYFFHRLAPFLSSSEPFAYISPTAYRAWKAGELAQVENTLSNEIEDKRHPHFNCHAHANRAIVRIRRGNLNGALSDLDGVSVADAQTSPIVYIAKLMTFIAMGKCRNEIDSLGSVDLGDATSFVSCVKSLLLFEAELRDKLDGDIESAELPSLVDADISSWTKTRKLLLLAEHSIRRGKYNEAVQLLASTPDLDPSHHTPEAETIPLLFGWTIYDLEYMVKQLVCLALFASGRTHEVDCFLQVNKDRHGEEDESGKADLGWLAEKLGDAALRCGNYVDSITWYSKALDVGPKYRIAECRSEFAKKCLSAIGVQASDTVDGPIAEDLTLMDRYPPGPSRLYAKRSKARALQKLWDDALKDADEAINIDDSCPLGYERRYVALYALHQHQEATEALGQMVTKTEESTDSGIHQLLTKYTRTIREIDAQIEFIFKMSPLVLIHVETGQLCVAAKRIEMFKQDLSFHELVVSMSAKLDTDHIKRTVANYFRYVMFSHTWEGQEPTFQEVSAMSVYGLNSLDEHPLRLKLRHFCETVQADPERCLWAWSDTCCIDKTNATDFKKSLRSMYKWYKESALTIVLLAKGPTLKYNRWMTRAWTLQELLSPNTIRFYNRDWTPYQGNAHSNHKASPDILQELAEAIDIPQNTLIDFSPNSLSIRAKLRLASTRSATNEVDIAYALIGIFSSDLTPDPEQPDPKVPLGLLLQEIVHRERDVVAVLDWIGISSQFNSCLPNEISVYKRSPYALPSISESKMGARVAELRDALPREEAITFFASLSKLNPVAFVHRRLSLPCITFSVSLFPQNNLLPGQSTDYQAQAAMLGQFEFKTSCTALTAQEETVLVYPWVHDLLARADAPEWDDYTRALRLIVYLEQPFRGLLLVKRSIHTYKRVAADAEILVPKWKVKSLGHIGTNVLEIR